MAARMHGPPPLPILRQACRPPSSSSHLGVCSCYRWFAASYSALRTESPRTAEDSVFTVSHLQDWKIKLEQEQNERQQQRRPPIHQESVLVGQSILNSRTAVESSGEISSAVSAVNGLNINLQPSLNRTYEKLSTEENVGRSKNLSSQSATSLLNLAEKSNVSREDIPSGGIDVSNVSEQHNTRDFTPTTSNGAQMTAELSALESPIDCKEAPKRLPIELPPNADNFSDELKNASNSLPSEPSNAANASNEHKETFESLPSASINASDSSKELKDSPKPLSPAKTPVLSDTTKLACTMNDVFIVDNAFVARTVLSKLRGEYKDLVHACDTEVADIDVRKQSPVGHGRVICFSIYCGPNTDFGNKKSCVWVDTLDSNVELLHMFKEYFEDSTIKKVWHNFSFDRHVLANHGIKIAGFYADTMQLARLWHSGRKGAEGSYSLESLTSDFKVMDGAHSCDAQTLTKKTSMMELFGAKKLKKDGTEGSLTTLLPVEELQRNDPTRELWICYSSGDAICTWRLWESLHAKLMNISWVFENKAQGSMYTFYDRYWRLFGELLADMEEDGMLVDREYLKQIEKIACKERAISVTRFRRWMAKYCPYAKYINVGSDSQLRQLLYGGYNNTPKCREFKVPNIDGFIEEGKKAPLKYRTIEICGVDAKLPCHSLTSGGLPSVTMQALKSLAGKVSIDYAGTEEEEQVIPQEADAVLTSEGVKGSKELEEPNVEDISAYGHAYHAFNGGEEGKEACKALAALCEISAIDCLITGFIQPLQGGDSMGPDNRVHCSLNLNTETGRLSARRPNLQNQPALEKDRYKIRQAFISSPGNSLIVADYGQLELRLLAHLADCKSMLEAFRIGGDFHSRTAMNMYDNVKVAVENGEVLLEWEPKSGEDSPPAPLLKNVYAAERRKAKMLNFSIAYGKTARGLSKDWKVTLPEAQDTVKLWYRDRAEVRRWQAAQKKSAKEHQCVYTLLGRARHFPDVKSATDFQKGRVDRAAINTPVQGSAADVAMLAMIELWRNVKLKELGWKLLLQVHDEMILEGPSESAALAKELVVDVMSHPFDGKNILKVDLVVDAKYANNWYAAK